MDELICREDAIAEIENAQVRVSGLRIRKCIITQYTDQCRNACAEAVRNLPPVVDVEPVRHGRWIFIGKTASGSRITRCSYCGKEGKNQAKSAYCKDCGAKMDLDLNHIEEVTT